MFGHALSSDAQMCPLLLTGWGQTFLFDPSPLPLLFTQRTAFASSSPHRESSHQSTAMTKCICTCNGASNNSWAVLRRWGSLLRPRHPLRGHTRSSVLLTHAKDCVTLQLHYLVSYTVAILIPSKSTLSALIDRQLEKLCDSTKSQITLRTSFLHSSKEHLWILHQIFQHLWNTRNNFDKTQLLVSYPSSHHHVIIVIKSN